MKKQRKNQTSMQINSSQSFNVLPSVNTPVVKIRNHFDQLQKIKEQNQSSGQLSTNIPFSQTQYLNNKQASAGSFVSTGEILNVEKKEQQMLIKQNKNEANRALFQQVSSAQSQSRSQFLSSFYSQNTANAGGFGGQSNFLKAYSTKVKWMPPASTKNEGTSKIISMKERRENSIHDTVSKMKQFQLTEHSLKGNDYYLDKIDQLIEDKISASLENDKIQKDSTQEQVKRILDKNQSKHMMIKSGATTTSVISLAETPEDSVSPVNRKPQQMDITHSAILALDQANMSHSQLKQSRFRTTSNLKKLMKPISELKLEVHQNTKKSTVREVNKRAEFVSDLLFKDNITNIQNSIWNGASNLRDISYKDEAPNQQYKLISKQAIAMQYSTSLQNLNQNSNTIITFKPAINEQTQANPLLQSQKKQKQFTNLQFFPQNLESLQKLTENLSQAEHKIPMIKKERLKALSESFILSPPRIQNSQSQQHLYSAQKDTNQYLLQQYSSYQKLQAHLTEDITVEKTSENQQIELYRQREQELLISLEKLNLSSRIDTIAIQEWMANMIQEINENKEKINDQQKFELLQLIYNMTFIELGKQVSSHCTERGQLLNMIWSAFLTLMNQQLKMIRAEKNVLERETVLQMDKFHRYYEDQMQSYRDQSMKMFKESQNYKRSYERLFKDYEQLKDKTTKIGQQLQEVTILYKQQFTKSDQLQKQNNNLRSILQTLQEQSEDEDPNLQNDYFKEGRDALEWNMKKKKTPDDFGFLGEQPIDQQFQLLDTLGKDIAGFIEGSDEKREREVIALQSAENFALTMMGDFFKDMDTQVDQTFYDFLKDQQKVIDVEMQIEAGDLIKIEDKDTLVNEDILFEDTGINVRNSDEQQYLARIKELEDELAKMSEDLRSANEKLDFQITFNELQKDRIEQLENQLDEKTKQLDENMEFLEQVQDELTEAKNDMNRYKSKCKKQKEQLESQEAEINHLNYQIERQQQLLDDNNQSADPLQQSNYNNYKQNKGMLKVNRGKHHKTGSDISKHTYGSGGNDYGDDDNNISGESQVSRRKIIKGNTPSSFFLFSGGDRLGKYKFLEFNFNRKGERKQRTHPSQIAFEKFKKKKKITNIMPKTLLLKSITGFYADLSELHRSHRMPPLCPYVYDSMMQKYGIKKIGLQKFKQLLGTVVKLSDQCIRIKLFGQLFKLVRPEYDANDIKTYIEVLTYLQNLNIGVKIDNNEGKEQHYTPYVRAFECLRYHFEGKIPIDEWAELKKKLDNTKTNDPKNINKQGLVEIDPFIDLVLIQYHRLDKLAAEKAYELFLACDFNGNAFISVDEFTIAYRNVVQNNLGKEYAQLIFADYVEGLQDPENNCNLYGFSFDTFLQVALELDILKIKDQNLFLIPLNLDKQFSDLQQAISGKLGSWKQRLISINQFSDEWKLNFDILYKQVKEESLSKRILLLRAKLLDEETKLMINDYLMDQYFTNDLNSFVKIGIEDVYNKDFVERNRMTKEEIKEKKKAAGITNTNAILGGSPNIQGLPVEVGTIGEAAEKTVEVDVEGVEEASSPTDIKKKKKKKKGKKNKDAAA